MRPRDILDYWRLAHLCRNPLAVVRYRKRRGPADLEVRLAGGARLRVRAGRQDFHIFRNVFAGDEYALDPLEGAGLENVVDVGANAGYFAARVAPFAERVVCYEPDPENCELLAANLKSFDGIEIARAAVAGETGELPLYRAREQRGTGLHSLHFNAALHSETPLLVPCVSLEDLFARHALDTCDLLKLDAEGAEYPILYRAPPSLLARIHRIHGEYHDRDETSSNGASLAHYLTQRGYRVTLRPSRKSRPTGHFFATRLP